MVPNFGFDGLHMLKLLKEKKEGKRRKKLKESETNGVAYSSLLIKPGLPQVFLSLK